jgi:superoxide dismutase, Cu-Zn family
MIRIALLVPAFAALVACTSVGQIPTAKVASTTLRQANGTPAGTAIITAAGDKLTLSIASIGLPAGSHGAHLHMTGRCEGPAFTSAGGHLNPGGKQHGTLNSAGSHTGDLPNLTIVSNGAGTLSVELSGTRAELEAALFDADGTALVIHATADDYKTDPTGNSGARIACGVLTRG